MPGFKLLPHALLYLVCTVTVFADSAVQGVKNFQCVDENVYRGAQPSGEGFANLAKLGVKTVIDLREAGSRSAAEEQAVKAAGMSYINVPMTGLAPPSEAEITKILDLMEGKDAGPVFVHCLRGADRTGAVVAAYRIDHNGWDNDRALHEAKSMGMSFFQYPRKRFIMGFQPRVLTAHAVESKPTAPALAITPAVVTAR